MDDLPAAGLNFKQTQTLRQFRERVQDVLKPDHDDYFLLRWLRARHFDITKAEKMLRNSLEFREKWGADTILDDYQPPEVLLKYWPGSQFGFDKEGHPLIIGVSAELDFRGIMRCVKKEDIIKFIIYRIEKDRKVGRENGRKLGKRVEQVTQINDMDGFSWQLLWTPGGIDLMKEVMPKIEANYPENLYRIFVINAPTIFPLLYNVCKPFMAEETKKKVKILGSNWKEQLLEYIDADQLPVYWGGTCTDPDGDPRCRSRVVTCGEVPKSYYRSENFNFDPEKAKTVTVGARTSHAVEMPIHRRGTVIRDVFVFTGIVCCHLVCSKEPQRKEGRLMWMFKTKHSSIKISMFQQRASGIREIIPSTLVDSHLIPEDGHVMCEERGMYVLMFDNSDSWLYSREVTYQIDIEENELPADGDE